MSQGQKVIKYLAIVFAACLTITILGVILNIVVSIFGAFVPKHSTNSSSSTYNQVMESDSNKTFTDVEEIKIDSGVYAFKIVRDSSIKGVKVTTEKITNDLNIYYQKDNKCLVTEEEGFWDNIFRQKHSSKGKVSIFVGDDISLENIDVDMGVGNFVIEDIETEKLNIDCGVGTLTCKGVKANKADIDGGVGELKCEDVVFRDLELDGGVGEIDISGQLVGKTELVAGMGELNADIIGKREDYNLKVETGLGAIIIDGEKYKDTNDYNNNQSNILDIEGGIGTVKVDFR